MEEQLRSIWSRVLNIDKLNVKNESNFFQIGGDSVKSIALAGQASDSGLQLYPETIFEHPEFADMAKHTIEISIKDQASSTSDQKENLGTHDVMRSWDLIKTCLLQCGIENQELEDIYPCAPFQEALMLSAHDDGVWTFQAVFEVGGEKSLPRAKQAIEFVRQRNPALRSRIVQYHKELYNVVVNSQPEWKEFSGTLSTYKEMELNKRFHYGDKLDRLAVVRDSESIYLVWTKVHAVYDRWSKIEFMQDLQNAFVDPTTFSASQLRAPFRSFVDYISNQNRQKSLDFWNQKFQGLENWQILWPDNTEIQGKYTTSKTQWQRKIIPYKPLKSQIGLDAVAQVAWSLTLANESQLNDVFFMQLRSCRQMAIPNVHQIIGPCWSPCPVRNKLNANQTLSDLLNQVHRKTQEGIPHEPFGLPAALHNFGHQRFLQFVLIVQPPQPDSFEANIDAKDENGSRISMRSAEPLWTQARGSFGFYVVLTPKENNTKLEIWTRFDESFIDAERVGRIDDAFAEIFELVLTRKWEDVRLKEICPHLVNLTDADNEEEMSKETPTTLTGIFRKKTDEPALIIPGINPLTLSHNDLHSHVAQMQQNLANIGIRKDSAVSIVLPNSTELIVVFLAATWQRGIAAPLNPAYKEDEFGFYIDDLGSSVVIIPNGAYQEEGPAVKAARKYKAKIVECYWDGQKVAFDVKEKGDGIEKEEVLEARGDDVALVLHTSGTTGRPKAVPLTHTNLLASIENICATYKLMPTDRTLLIMPLFHVHGLLASFLSPLYSGGSAIVPERLTPDFWKSFAHHQATWYTATPSMHRVILQFQPPEKEALERLRFIRSCSSQLSPALFEELQEKFQAPVLESYAMTEASHLMTSNPLPPGERFPGCVGQATTRLELRILDEEGKSVEQGKEGEVGIRGNNVTKGYLNNPDANKSSFTQDGFFRTGDQGKLNQDGYLTLTGRLKELVNKGGEKISPVEIDNLLNQHQTIAEAVSFAIEDEAYGQDVGCAVKLIEGGKLDEGELRTWVEERLSTFKVPKKVWFPNEIPKTATGKVQRKQVAEAMSKAG